MKKYLLTVMLMAFAAPSAFAAGENTVGLDLSIDGGGIAIGADYIRAMAKNWGIGGYFQFIDHKSGDGVSLVSNDLGLIAFGAQANVHYEIDRFDVYVKPGLGLLFVTGPSGWDTQTSFGPRLAIGASYKINSQWAVGLENVKYWSWFNTIVNGLRVDDLAIRGTYTF